MPWGRCVTCGVLGCRRHVGAPVVRPRGRRLVALRARFEVLSCGRCGSRSMPWYLDHIVPLAEGGTNDVSNFQRLCKPCHAAKTARERW